MKTLNPYLSFAGKCREAMTFYNKCFGGNLSFMTVGESPICDQMPPGSEQQIMHSSLTFGGGTIMATDMSPQEAPPTKASIALDCSTHDEAQKLFNAFEDGGQVICPLGPAFWGGEFAAVTDKYGVNWMITFNDQPAA